MLAELFWFCGAGRGDRRPGHGEDGPGLHVTHWSRKWMVACPIGRKLSKLADLFEQRIPLIVALVVQWCSRQKRGLLTRPPSAYRPADRLPRLWTTGAIHPLAQHTSMTRSSLHALPRIRIFFCWWIRFILYWNGCQRSNTQVSPDRTWLGRRRLDGLVFWFQAIWSMFRASLTGQGTPKASSSPFKRPSRSSPVSIFKVSLDRQMISASSPNVWSEQKNRFLDRCSRPYRDLDASCCVPGR